MDQQKLRLLVFEKTGVRIDVDDPIFALVALNEAVLAEAVERHVALLDQATAKLAQHAEALQLGAAAPRPSARARSESASVLLFAAGPGDGTVDGGGAEPRAGAVPAAASGLAVGADARFVADKRLNWLIAGAALLTAALVLIGQSLFLRPPPAPVAAPIIQARELTAAQTAAIQNSEKLTRIIQKLDQKTRNTIQAELQKP
jgi:hypothetical protein